MRLRFPHLPPNLLPLLPWASTLLFASQYLLFLFLFPSITTTIPPVTAAAAAQAIYNELGSHDIFIKYYLGSDAPGSQLARLTLTERSANDRSATGERGTGERRTGVYTFPYIFSYRDPATWDRRVRRLYRGGRYRALRNIEIIHGPRDVSCAFEGDEWRGLGEGEVDSSDGGDNNGLVDVEGTFVNDTLEIGVPIDGPLRGVVTVRCVAGLADVREEGETG